mmetsp:Transcript_33283/g.53334  ORF Transcript_33283/g.53334 Transcript_33283/m.53334 type:complete len:304 (+) Transcript_33283:1719-2630(+)
MADAQPSAPPEPHSNSVQFEPVDPNAVPPSFNPECIPADNQTTQRFNGDNEGQIQQPYQMEGSPFTARYNNEAYNIPQDIPPPDYPTTTKTNPDIKQPLIVSDSGKNNSSSMQSYSSSPLVAGGGSYTAKTYRCWENACDCDCDWRRFLKRAGIIWIVAAVLLIWGSFMLDHNLAFNRRSEKTTCTIRSVDTHSCSYDCHCHTDSKGNKHCDTCYGSEYEYSVTSDLCDGQTLHQNSYDGNGSCPQSQKSVGSTQTCWVECDSLEFSFSSPHSLIAWSIVMIVIGSCCFCGGAGFGCKNCGRF